LSEFKLQLRVSELENINNQLKKKVLSDLFINDIITQLDKSEVYFDSKQRKLQEEL